MFKRKTNIIKIKSFYEHQSSRKNTSEKCVFRIAKNYNRLVIRYFSYYISSNKIKLVAISLVKILFIEKAEL